MEVAFNIPIWLMWLIGVPCGLVVLFFAVIGAMFLWSWRNGPFG